MDKLPLSYDQPTRNEEFSAFQRGIEGTFQRFTPTGLPIDTTARTSPAISNLISGARFPNLQSVGLESNANQMNLAHETAVIIDASSLENFGNHSIQADPSLLLGDEPHLKRKENPTPSSSAKKKQKRMTSEDDESSDSGPKGYDNYVNWAPYPFPLPPNFEPLPVSITLPFLRSFATKKFDAPIPVFVTPNLPVGQLHHFPALLTLSPFFSLPTAIPLYSQPISFVPTYYSYDDIHFSQQEEGESDEDSFDEEDEVVDESLVQDELKAQISPLTTLASLASGSVSTHK